MISTDLVQYVDAQQRHGVLGQHQQQEEGEASWRGARSELPGGVAPSGMTTATEDRDEESGQPRRPRDATAFLVWRRAHGTTKLHELKPGMVIGARQHSRGSSVDERGYAGADTGSKMLELGRSLFSGREVRALSHSMKQPLTDGGTPRDMAPPLRFRQHGTKDDAKQREDDNNGDGDDNEDDSDDDDDDGDDDLEGVSGRSLQMPGIDHSGDEGPVFNDGKKEMVGNDEGVRLALDLDEQVYRDVYKVEMVKRSRFRKPPVLRFVLIFGTAALLPGLLYPMPPVPVAVTFWLFYAGLGAYLVRLYVADRTVDAVYAGNPVNCMLQLPCDSAPALYMRQLPSLALACLFFYSLALFCVAVALPEGNSLRDCDRSLNGASGSECNTGLTSSYLNDVYWYIVVTCVGATFSMYISMRRAAQKALQRAVAEVCADPLAEEIVQVAEHKATKMPVSIWVHSRSLVLTANVFGLAVGVCKACQVLSDENSQLHVTTSAVAAHICSVVAMVLFFNQIPLIAYGLFASYKGAHHRIEAVNDFIRVHGAGDLKSLNAFFVTRELYIAVVNTCTFDAANAALVAVLVLFLQTSISFIVGALDLIVSDVSARAILRAFWQPLVFAATHLSVFLLALATLNSVATEMTESVSLLKDVKIRFRSLSMLVARTTDHTDVEQITGGVLKRAIATRRQRVPLSRTLGLHGVIGSRTSELAPLMQLNAGHPPHLTSLEQFESYTEGLIEHCTLFDILPNLLGIPVSPLIVKSLAAYGATLATAVVLTIWQTIVTTARDPDTAS